MAFPTSTVIQTIADAIGEHAAAIGYTPVVWPRGALPGRAPWAVIGLPDITRGAVDEAEPQLGSNGWTLAYTVTLLEDVSEPLSAHTRLVAGMEAWVKRVDANRDLGFTSGLPSAAGAIEDASVETGDPITVEPPEGSSQKPLLGYETTVAVLAFIP